MNPSRTGRRLELYKPAAKFPTDKKTDSIQASPSSNIGFLQGWERAGKYVWKRTIRRDSPFGQRSESLLAGRKLEDLVFYDLETTGLSAGAGTIAFLAGFGHIIGRDFLLEQFFLSDFPGEPEFLRQISTYLDSRSCFVSYNGKAFDRHLLLTRFRMNRIIPDLAGEEFIPCQLDLLNFSRKLWKRALQDCSLNSIEHGLLGVVRTLDIPGEMVPVAYFQFLQTGSPEPLLAVVEHHQQDILSLGTLLSTIDRLLETPSTDGPHDKRALGRMLSAMDREKSLQVLRRGFEQGDLRCGQELAVIFRREGRWDEAAGIWQAGIRLDAFDLDFHTSLAKYLEHKSRDIGRALDLVERMLQSDVIRRSGTAVSSLVKRRERLRKKQALKKR